MWGPCYSSQHANNGGVHGILFRILETNANLDAMWEESSTLPTLDTKQDLMRECFPLLFSFSHHRHRKQKRFSIRMCQALPAQMGKKVRIHTSTSITTDVIHSTIWTLSTIVATLGSSVLIWAFHVLRRLRASYIIFGPEKSYLKYAPFYSFLVSLWALLQPLDPILVSCTIVMAP